MVFVPKKCVSDKQKLLRGDILIAASSGSLSVVGKAARCLDNFEGSFGAFCKVLRPSHDIDSHYFSHYFRTPEYRHTISNLAAGANINNLRNEHLSDLRIPLPSLDEQKRIAAMLDKADELRRKRRESITALDSLTHSIFLDLFGDPVTNPFGFKTIDLGSQLDFLTSGSRGWAQYYSDEGSLFLRIQNVCSGQLQLDDVAYVNAPDTAEAKRTLVQAGDVLLSITADLGRTAVVPVGIGSAYINQHLAILRSSSINPTYLAQFLLTDAGQRQFGMLNKSAVKAGLNFSDIRSVNILLPPKDLQEEFAKRCTAIQTQRERLLAAQSETENLFTALQQKAFAQ
jgi:type I restriction enzyme S subunit